MLAEQSSKLSRVLTFRCRLVTGAAIVSLAAAPMLGLAAEALAQGFGGPGGSPTRQFTPYRISPSLDVRKKGQTSQPVRPAIKGPGLPAPTTSYARPAIKDPGLAA